MGTVGIDLIRDEANEFAPHRRPGQELSPLGENLADMIAHVSMATQDAFETTYTTPVESILGSSTAPSSSR